MIPAHGQGRVLEDALPPHAPVRVCRLGPATPPPHAKPSWAAFARDPIAADRSLRLNAESAQGTSDAIVFGKDNVGLIALGALAYFAASLVAEYLMPAL
jgi:hypothetical protein